MPPDYFARRAPHPSPKPLLKRHGKGLPAWLSVPAEPQTAFALKPFHNTQQSKEHLDEIGDYQTEFLRWPPTAACTG
jgi:hypothetical protein